MLPTSVLKYVRNIVLFIQILSKNCIHGMEIKTVNKPLWAFVHSYEDRTSGGSLQCKCDKVRVIITELKNGIHQIVLQNTSVCTKWPILPLLYYQYMQLFYIAYNLCMGLYFLSDRIIYISYTNLLLFPLLEFNYTIQYKSST